MNFYRAIIILLIFLVSCSPAGKLNESSATKDKQEIAFHSFLAYRSYEGVQIEEMAKVFRNGSIKEINKDHSGMMNPVEISFLDKSSKRIKSTFIEHPLIDVLEYAGQNDEIKILTVLRDSLVFTVRYNHNPEIREILFLSQRTDTLPINQKLLLKK